MTKVSSSLLTMEPTLGVSKNPYKKIAMDNVVPGFLDPSLRGVISKRGTFSTALR